MLAVALIVVAATAAGIACQRRTLRAPVIARWALSLILYVLTPFVSYVNIAHLHLSVGTGVGLLLAYVGLAVAGTLTWLIGRRMGLGRASLGAVIVSVLIFNTGYLGLPMTSVLLGTHALSHASAFDQGVGAPMLFGPGFAVGAMFAAGRGAGASFRAGERLRLFVTRNPPLWGAVAGLIVPASFAPHVLVSAVHVIVIALLALGFFAVGVLLSSERSEDRAPLLERPDGRVALALAMRFAITPGLLAVVALAGVGIPGAYLLEAAMPTGINSLTIGHAFGLDQRLIATVIVWGTIAVLVVGLLASVI